MKKHGSHKYNTFAGFSHAAHIGYTSAVSRFTAGQGGGKRKYPVSPLKHYSDKKRIVIKEKLAQSRSFTKTKTDNMKTDFAESRNGTSTKRIHVSTGLSKPKGLAKGTMLYHDSYAGSLQWLGGYEKYSTISYVGSAFQWLQGSTNSNYPNRAGQSYIPWFDLNPMEGTAAGQFTGAQAESKFDKMANSRGELFFDMFNRTEAPCHVELEFWVAKRDDSNGPLSFYNEAVSNNVTYVTTATIPTYPQVPTVSGNAPSNFLPATPMVPDVLAVPVYSNINQKRLVRSQWKKVKVCAFLLGGQSSQHVTVDCTLNQMGMRERLTSIINSSLAYPKGTLAVIMKCRGTALPDNTGGFGVPMVISAGEVGYVVNRKITMNAMKVTAARFESEYDGFAVTFGAPVTDFRILDQAQELAEALVTN